jgi:hypothetical protein
MQLRPRKRFGAIADIRAQALSALASFNYLTPADRSNPKTADFTATKSQAKAVERISLQYG